jgi:hypothetical protein
MYKKTPLLLLPLFLIACGGGPEKRSLGGEDKKKRRASEYVSGYDGKPMVNKTGNSPPEVKFAENPRYLIYVTAGRSRERIKGDGPGKSRVVSKKVPKTFVITDGSAVKFRAKYKLTDYRKLKGAVQPVSISRFDEIIRGLENTGFKRLDGDVKAVGGELVGTQRAIHLEIAGKRRSLYKQSQEALGSKVSPRAIFTRCEQYIIKLFYPPGSLSGG